MIFLNPLYLKKEAVWPAVSPQGMPEMPQLKMTSK